MFMADESIQTGSQPLRAATGHLLVADAINEAINEASHRTPGIRPCRTSRSLWCDALADSAELLKTKHFGTLPKLCWLSEGRQGPRHAASTQT